MNSIMPVYHYDKLISIVTATNTFIVYFSLYIPVLLPVTSRALQLPSRAECCNAMARARSDFGTFFLHVRVIR